MDKKIVDLIKQALELIFGSSSAIPRPVLVTLGILVLLAVAIYATYGLFLGISKIGKLWAEEIRPRLYDDKEKQRSTRRRYFAGHIEREMHRIDAQEDWRDYRFTDLEAEVESETSYRSALRPFKKRRGLRREKSLAKALARSQERLILLEGDPGAGKSVALRHLAANFARHAIKSRNADSLVPLYINLKGLQREAGAVIDRNLIERYVRTALNRNDRAIEEFLDIELAIGMQRGSWLLLFDSFDEIPEVLSSPDADAAVRNYALAIDDFLGGLNRCRGIVASREFRGPQRLGWPRFRILAMPSRVQRMLIRRADLEPAIANTTYGNLVAATDPEITAMAGNPLFLSLLCEYVRTGREWPANAHVVFETFVNSRLTRDEKKLFVKFNLKPAAVRRHAEHIAFCMASDPEVSLSPTRKALRAALTRARLPNVDNTVLNALEFMKLARPENDLEGDERTFTFAHRRFQEYFATSVVLREPVRVSTTDLLMNPRWRETAVVMLQTQSDEVIAPLVNTAETILAGMIQVLGGAVMPNSTEDDEEPGPQPVNWPAGTLHLLGLLQAGLARRPAVISPVLREYAGRLLDYAFATGTLLDRRWALEVAGIVNQQRLLALIQKAFNSGSRWMRDIAYRQVARLSAIGEDSAVVIRAELVDMYRRRRLRTDRDAMYAHLNRLADPSRFLPIVRLLLLAPVADAILLAAVALYVISIGSSKPLSVVTLPLISVAYLSAPWLAGFAVLTRRSSVPFSTHLDGFIAASIAAYARAGILLAPTRPTVSNRALIMVALLWMPAAIWASYSGQVPSVLYWPFLPLWFLFYLTAAAFRRAKRVTWRELKFIVAIITFVVAISIAGILAATLFPKVTTMLSMIVFGSAIAFATYAFARPRVRDYFTIKRWSPKARRYDDVRELLMFVQELKVPAARAEVLRFAREQNRVAPTEDNELYLRNAAIELERSTYTMRVSPEVLDELNIFVERIHTLRAT